MKKKYLILIFSLISIDFYSQQKMDVENMAQYKLTFRDSKKKNEEPRINTFVLLFNTKESFFKNTSLYVKDSLEKSGKIRVTGDVQKDYETLGKYVPDLPFTIYKKENQITFANEITFAGEFKYSETVTFNWKISKETNIINGVKCIKATTTKWGRNWVAFYSPSHPMPFGPYKFYGLPGLIFKVADDKNDYVFELFKYKKRKVKNFELFNFPKAKLISKSNYNKIRKQTALHPSFIDGEKNQKMKRDVLKFAEEQEKNYNPIELTD